MHPYHIKYFFIKYFNYIIVYEYDIYFKKDKICTHESLHRIIKTHTRQATKYNINKMILMRYIDIRTRLFSFSIQHYIYA